MPIRYDYRICPDCGCAYAVQVDEDEQPVTEVARTLCYECQPIAPDAEVIEWPLMRRHSWMLADADEGELERMMSDGTDT